MYLFGSGSLYTVPTADALGNVIVNPTPLKLAVLQDVSVDMSFDTKLLHGQNQFAVAVGRGKGKIAVKAKFANMIGAAFATLFSGATATANGTAAVNDTTGILIPATPFTITASTTSTLTTIQIPSTGTWLRDLGVLNASGVPMTRVASAPTTGQYTVAAGVYVFAAADVALQVFISYEYTFTSTTAKQVQVTNTIMGYAPTVAIALSAPYQGKNFHLRFPQAISSKLGLSFKNDDFVIPEMDFDVFADGAGNIYYASLTE